MHENLISAVPVVDEDGKIVASFSSTRLRGLSADQFGDLLLPIDQFLAKYAANSHVVTVSVDDTTETILQKMIGQEAHRHRVWVVENGKPIGVVSMTDIMKEIRDTGTESR